jgi:hypothetical protein
MKKAALIVDIILLILLFASCSGPKALANNDKKTIDGNWQLQTVQSEGITGTVKSQLFNEADFNCFIGSTWNFNRHNSLGSYTIAQNSNECASIKRNVKWSLYQTEEQPKLFQFKRLDEKLNVIEDNSTGYTFTILQLEPGKMQLKSDLTFAGKPAAFIYNFVKI